MESRRCQELLKELRDLRHSDSKPFPYQGGRRLISEGDENLKDFIPDLNTYFMDIFGYASWDYKILKWLSEKIQKVKKDLSKSFFEKYHQYAILEQKVTQENTPDLYDQFMLYESIRQSLLILLEELPSD
jgi:hypothetical protein